MPIELDAAPILRTAIAIGATLSAFESEVTGGPAGSTAVAWGPRSFKPVVPTPPEPPPPTGSPPIVIDPPVVGDNVADISVELWNETDTVKIGNVQHSHNRTWEISLPDLATGEATVPQATATEYIAANQLAEGRHLRFRLRDGTPTSMRIVSERSVEYSADPGEMVRTIECVDKRAVLDAAQVRPMWGTGAKPQSETRAFAWYSHPRYSSWPKAHVAQPMISFPWKIPQTDPPWHTPWDPPLGWPHYHTPIIQPRPGIVMPSGKWGATFLFYAYGAEKYHFVVAGLDEVEIYIDDIKVGQSGDESKEAWTVPWTGTVELKEGFHRMSVEVTKHSHPLGGLPGTLANFRRRSFVAVNAFRLTHGVNTVLSPSNLAFTTSGQWRVLNYPHRFPTWEPGRILERLILEAKQRGALPSGLNRTFTSTHDSAGRPWDLIPEQIYKNSDTLWDVLRQLQKFGVESRMVGNGYNLDVFTSARFTGSKPIKISKAERITEPRKPNQYLVQYAKGQFLLPTTPPSPTIEGLLSLGDIRSRGAARAIAQAELDQNAYSRVRWTADADLVGNDNVPTRDWGVGDWAEVANNSLRVVGLTIAENDALNATTSAEFQSPEEFAEEGFAQRLARAAPGVTAETSSLIRWLDDGVSAGFIERESVPNFSQSQVITEAEDVERGRSSNYTMSVPTQISLIRMTSVGMPSAFGGVIVHVRRNGSTVQVLWMPGGIRHVVVLPIWLVFQANDTLQVATTQSSPGAGLLAVTFHAAVASPGAVRPGELFPWL